MPTCHMSINIGLAGRAESLEGPAEGHLKWGKKSPRCKQKRSDGTGDTAKAFLERMEDDEELLLGEPQAQQAGMGPAADSSAFSEPQIAAQQQQQADHGSWAALGAPGGAEERPQSNASSPAYPPNPRLSSSDHQQQQGNADQAGRRDSAEPESNDEVEYGAEEGDDFQGWQSTSKTCCFCDNGGQIIYCDGPCQRAFHYGVEPKYFKRDTNEEAEGGSQDLEEIERRDVYNVSHCNPLRMDQELMHYLCSGHNTFECPNCLAKEHQCFYCKQDGKENEDVFKCTVGSCGRFYHKQCLVKNNPRCKEQAVEGGIWGENGFICPLHSCAACQRGEEAADRGQLIACARCPVAYHLFCLPQEILESEKCRVWLNDEERDRWGEDHELFQRDSIEQHGGVEDCILYCHRHPIPEDSANPEHQAPLVPERLLGAWEIHMADEHRHLAWSQEFRRARQEAAERERAEAERRRAAREWKQAAARQEQKRLQRQKLQRQLKLRQKQEQAQPAAKRKLEPSEAVKGKAEPPGQPKLKKVVKKGAPEHAPPSRTELADELEDLPLAKRVRRGAAAPSRPSSATAAPAARELKQRAKAAGRGAASPTFSDLDSTPIQQVRKKRMPASGKPRAALLLGSPQRPAPAKQLAPSAQARADLSTAGALGMVLPGRAAPTQPVAASAPVPPAQAGLPGSPEQAQREPAVVAAPQPAEDMAEPEPEPQGSPLLDGGLDQAEAGEDVGALMDTYFGSDDEVELPGFIGLEASPPPAVAPEAAAELAAEAEHWAVDNMAARLAAMLEQAKARNPIERTEILTPKPFDNCTTATIPQTRLEEMARTVKMQQIMDRNKANTSSLLSRADVVQMFQYQDRMQTYLAPFLHRDRYTSYGRHFTQNQHLRALNEFLLPHIMHGDTVVDFSCGANVWVPMLKNMCLEAGIAIEGISYDIITPRCMEDFFHGTWYDVEPGSLPNGNQLIIGLNPPFGRNGSLAAEFARLAAYHRPRLIVLVVPPATPIPEGYTSIKEETSLMVGEAFFVPGSTERSWNATTPSTRILVRNDLYQQVLDMAGLECIAHHNFEPRMQPGIGRGMPMQVHRPITADYLPAHPMYPVKPIMSLPY